MMIMITTDDMIMMMMVMMIMITPDHENEGRNDIVSSNIFPHILN